MDLIQPEMNRNVIVREEYTNVHTVDVIPELGIVGIFLRYDWIAGITLSGKSTVPIEPVSWGGTGNQRCKEKVSPCGVSPCFDYRWRCDSSSFGVTKELLHISKFKRNSWRV